MNWANAIFNVIWTLFVDDAAFALMAVIWLAVMYLVAAMGFNSGLEGVLLFFGLGLVLVFGALRRTWSR